MICLKFGIITIDPHFQFTRSGGGKWSTQTC